MSDYVRCKTCGNFGWRGSHLCPPVWQYQIPDWHGEEETSEIRADDAQEAAEKAVQRDDDDHIAFSSGIKVRVRRNQEDPWKDFEVMAEAVPVYRASEITTG